MIQHTVKSIAVAFFLLTFCFSASSQVEISRQGQVKGNSLNLTAKPVNDKQIQADFLKKAEELYDAKQFTPFMKLNEQISNEYCNVDLSGLSNDLESKDYEDKKSGVLIIGKLYKCASCPNNHLVTASAFVIGKDGLCVTNNHVFSLFPNDTNTYLATFVMDSEGNVFPVEEVLAASLKNDLALFKVTTNDSTLTPLSLGSNIETGDEISIVSHPDKQFYTYTKGYVSRYYLHPKYKAPRYSITAEFAKGSSGAPVFDDKGQVMGIVSATRSIYYKKDKNLQMVVREVIPVKGLKSLFKKGTKTKVTNQTKGKKKMQGMPAMGGL